jgi:hypothetical protein
VHELSVLPVRGALRVGVLVTALAAGATYAQSPAPEAPGLWIKPGLIKKLEPEADAPAEPVRRLPTFSADKRVYALASAVGGQLSYTVARFATGSNLDPYERRTLPMSDHTLDAVVLRGLDRVIARREPESERVFLRLNPVMLDGVAAPERENSALEQLTAEIAKWPERQQWERIVIVTPHYRGFERAGLGSKLHGVGVYVQNLENNTEYDVVEPDGTPGRVQRNRYVALYYYAQIWILDAKSLEVIDKQPWLIDEKIHDSQSSALHIGNTLPPHVLAQRIEQFVEKASDSALARTLGGRVEARDLREVAPSRQPR